MHQLTLTLDLPPQACRPNYRKGARWKSNQERAVARDESKVRTLSAMNEAKLYVPPKWKRARGQAVWYFKKRGRRDPTNLNATLKWTLDGFVQAGLLADDDHFHWDDPVVLIDKERPRLEITITKGEST